MKFIEKKDRPEGQREQRCKWCDSQVPVIHHCHGWPFKWGMNESSANLQGRNNAQLLVENDLENDMLQIKIYIKML
jgi:hypothetical protein